MLVNVWILCILCYVQVSAHITLEIIKTTHGLIRGKETETENGNYVSFEGIPYAKPPIGNLRFKPPLSALIWHDVRDATSPRSSCIQESMRGGTLSGSEDCLYLNIYMKQRPSDSEGLLPVLVHIHGGGFLYGNGKMSLEMVERLLLEDIIIVSFNFRLGVFGFLSTGDSVCPGNMGLKDQVLALKWTRENIISFGGDSNRITLWGSSSGAASVHYHMLSPMSRGLFHGAISQSGSALNWWALIRNAPSVTQRIASVLGCDDQSSSLEIMNCLRYIDAHYLNSASRVLKEFMFHPLVIYGPVVETWSNNISDMFLHDEPMSIIEAGNISKTPWILGFNKNEGGIVLAEIMESEHLRNVFFENFDHLISVMMNYKFLPNLQEVTKAFRLFYFQNETLSMKHFHNLLDLFSDAFIHGVYQSAVSHSKHNPDANVYLYQLTHKGKVSLVSLMWTQYDYGVSHMDDLMYIMPPMKLLHFESRTPEETIADLVLGTWSRFIKTGNPTSGNFPLEWSPLLFNSPQYLALTPQPSMMNDIPHERMAFWNTLMDMMISDPKVSFQSIIPTANTIDLHDEL